MLPETARHTFQKGAFISSQRLIRDGATSYPNDPQVGLIYIQASIQDHFPFQTVVKVELEQIILMEYTESIIQSILMSWLIDIGQWYADFPCTVLGK